MREDLKRIGNAETTLQIGELSVGVREFTWAEIFETEDTLNEMGISGVDFEIEADAEGEEATRRRSRNVRRMFAVATTAVRNGRDPKEWDRWTFSAVAKLFNPRDDESMALLTRVYTLAMTGEEPLDEEPAGNDDAAAAG